MIVVDGVMIVFSDDVVVIMLSVVEFRLRDALNALSVVGFLDAWELIVVTVVDPIKVKTSFNC